MGDSVPRFEAQACYYNDPVLRPKSATEIFLNVNLICAKWPSVGRSLSVEQGEICQVYTVVQSKSTVYR